jgi:hypothetical protein
VSSKQGPICSVFLIDPDRFRLLKLALAQTLGKPYKEYTIDDEGALVMGKDYVGEYPPPVVHQGSGSRMWRFGVKWSMRDQKQWG